MINEWLKVVQQWSAYVSHCMEQPVQAPICRPLWTWVMFALFALGMAIAVAVIWKVISYKIKVAAALRAQAAREQIDHDAIENSRWDGDKAYSAELGGEEVERRIREVVYSHRRGKAESQDGMNVV